ncbi:UNVERIFIED_CONTAM: hypothetical protein Slati_3117900 [Sesamum latifolium]|uniref:Reverse transcriptase/retrotransposon-derived protein RNase H-like domain-containing protein n=1 Tax=Sesamum latifolium TaxID=2727402 RepID=A0AAW2UVJ2_9LAMI
MFGIHKGNFLSFMVSQRGIEANPEEIKAIIKMQSPKSVSWTEQCQATFEDLKKYLASPPLLTKPRPGKILLLYLAVSEGANVKTIFQSHLVVVLINHPLMKMLADPNISGMMVKWSIELSEHGIVYRPRPAIKAQSLADFISEST